MTNNKFRLEIERWTFYPTPDENPEYLRELDAAEAMEDYYRHVVITNFTQCRYKPGDNVKWTNPDGQHTKGTVIGTTSTPAQEYPQYVILEDQKIVTVDELTHGWITTETTRTNDEKMTPDNIPF
jgi:hypothetical protein